MAIITLSSDISKCIKCIKAMKEACNRLWVLLVREVFLVPLAFCPPSSWARIHRQDGCTYWRDLWVGSGL